MRLLPVSYTHLEDYLGQKEQGKQEEDIDSWLDIVKEYEARGETGQLETCLLYTSRCV